MVSNRLFTQEELDEMGKNFYRLALEALEKGDTDKAKFWILALPAVILDNMRSLSLC